MTQKTIVHIDDNSTFRQTFKDLMTDWGYNVLSFEDSKTAAGEVQSQQLKIAIVDSSGFSFAQNLRDTLPMCRRVVLSSNAPADPSVADAVVSKGSKWRSEILDYLDQFFHEETLQRRGRLDLFADPQVSDQLREKIAIVGGSPERILKEFDDVNAAMEYLETATKPCRIVQGPSALELPLSELRGDA